jgi:hypothetical protein
LLDCFVILCVEMDSNDELMVQQLMKEEAEAAAK